MRWTTVGITVLGLGISAVSIASGWVASPPSARAAATKVTPRAVLSYQRTRPGRPADGPLVVIDPGHGGTNAGAPGVSEVHEKELTLPLSQALGRALERRGVRVAYTRQDDRYLTLRQRSLIANQLDADAFVSVHANATEEHTERGYETYVLTPRALDVDGRALRVDHGHSRGIEDVRVTRVLEDLERGAAQPGAARLAQAIQRSLREVRGPAGDRGVRQGSMHVLLGANMPAVLVEVGFVDHPVEGRELLDPANQLRIAESLADAIAGQLQPPPSS